MRLRLAAGFLLLLPLVAGADHQCVDGYAMGAPIKRTNPMPVKWFQVGGADVTNPKTHIFLKRRYKKEYVSGYDEGPFGSLCLKTKRGYVAVTTSDFGPGVEYSEAPPKCLKCQERDYQKANFRSGTGLSLGITKAKASALLGAVIKADLTDVTFEETESNSTMKTLHSEVLSLEFKNDQLVRFSVYDFREGA